MGNVKINSGAVLILLLVGIFALSLFVNAANAQTGPACTPTTTACNQPITKAGFGAVEICGQCFPCGIPDGVCPENYTNGLNESAPEKLHIELKVGSDRPSLYSSSEYGQNPLIFSTGDAGCTSIGGVCTAIETKTNFGGSWSSSSIACSTDLTSNSYSNYYRAVCDSVPKTPGCQNCPDPDCQVNLEGLTYDSSNNQPLKAIVNVVSTNNWLIRANKTSTGHYSMVAPRGNVRVVCTYPDYTPTEHDVYLQPGKNVVDCGLTEAYCQSDCTLPNEVGQDVCRQKCDGLNSCSFQTGTLDGKTYDASQVCDGINPGGRVLIKRINDTSVYGVTCCTGAFETFSSSKFQVADNPQIKNLLTRSVRKTMNGEPIELKIIVYDKK